MGEGGVDLLSGHGVHTIKKNKKEKKMKIYKSERDGKKPYNIQLLLIA